MIATWSKPSSSRRLAQEPTKPSSMPDGATTSAPAARTTAPRGPGSRARRRCRRSPSWSTPQWPWIGVLAEAGVDHHDELGARLLDRARSPSARRPRRSRPRSRPRPSARGCRTGSPRGCRGSAASSASRDGLVDREVELPGQRADRLRTPVPGHDEQRVDEVVRGERVSRTMRRNAPVRRRRRGRVSGNAMAAKPSPAGTRDKLLPVRRTDLGLEGIAQLPYRGGARDGAFQGNRVVGNVGDCQYRSRCGIGAGAGRRRRASGSSAAGGRARAGRSGRGFAGSRHRSLDLRRPAGHGAAEPSAPHSRARDASWRSGGSAGDHPGDTPLRS